MSHCTTRKHVHPEGWPYCLCGRGRIKDEPKDPPVAIETMILYRLQETNERLTNIERTLDNAHLPTRAPDPDLPDAPHPFEYNQNSD